MTPRSPRRIRLLTIVAACALLGLAGCGGAITGTVFIDTNANGSFDTSETGVPFAKLIVTRDGSTVAERYADQGGNFSVPTRRGSGQVCVGADLSYAQQNLRNGQAQFGKDAAALTLRLAGAKGQTTTTGGTTGTTATTTTTTPTNTTTTTTPTNATTTTSEPVIQEGWINGRYCRKAKAGSFSILIPVKLDYSEALAELPTTKVKCYAGLPCELDIPYPGDCTLNPITLGEGVVAEPSEQAGLSISESQDVVSFVSSSRSTTSAKGQTGTQASLALSAPVSGSANVQLFTLEDIDVGKTSFTLKPTATCADQKLSLPEITLELIRDVDVGVTQDLKTAGELTAEQEMTAEVSVENRGKSVVTGGELLITLPAGAQFLAIDGLECHNYGKKLGCKIASLDPGSSRTATLSLQLPALADADIDSLTELTMSAEFSGAGLAEGKTIEAQPITFDVRKP